MVIGIIGGVGSGKSAVLNYFQNKYTADVIEADKVTKELMEEGSPIYEKVKKEFPEAFDENGLNRNALAEIVFNDAIKLDKLNNITHPATIDEIFKRISQSNAKYILVETALIIDTVGEDICDELWFVYCDKKERVRRLVEDRGYSKEKAESIIANQPSDDEYNTVCDEFIDNTFSFDKTKEQIDFALTSAICSQ